MSDKVGNHNAGFFHGTAHFPCLISVYNLESLFSDSPPEDVVAFAQEYANMDFTVFQKPLDSMTADDLKDISLTVFSALNVSSIILLLLHRVR